MDGFLKSLVSEASSSSLLQTPIPRRASALCYKADESADESNCKLSNLLKSKIKIGLLM
jgi:hypothetical protein